MARRISLIHATNLAVEPINAAFRTFWPEALTTNLLEDSLSRDLAAAGRLSPSMHQRFCDLTTYATRTGADAVLFTCSAFGPCIETARRLVAIPVLKPNEAMIDEAFARGTRYALIATFAPSIPSMREQFEEEAARRGIRIELSVHAVPQALNALHAGAADRRDDLIAERAGAAGTVDAIVLAQFSMARAETKVSARAKSAVLTSPRSAVERMRRVLGG